MLIYLVWDKSGSMGELGKLFIARSVARTIEQYLRFGYPYADLKLVAWSDKVNLIDWHPDHEFPPELLIPEAAVNSKALIAFFETQPSGKILVLTDGFWAHDDAKDLKRWKQNLQPPDTLRIIKIGADANPYLKGKDVFVSEDIFTAMDGWLEGGAT